jgi:hypothetical protein
VAAVAVHTAEPLPRGAWFCELADVATGTAAVDALASTLAFANSAAAPRCRRTIATNNPVLTLSLLLATSSTLRPG